MRPSNVFVENVSRIGGKSKLGRIILTNERLNLTKEIIRPAVGRMRGPNVLTQGVS